jgi:hypothetical protein
MVGMNCGVFLAIEEQEGTELGLIKLWGGGQGITERLDISRQLNCAVRGWCA